MHNNTIQFCQMLTDLSETLDQEYQTHLRLRAGTDQMLLSGGAGQTKHHENTYETLTTLSAA